MDKEESQTVGEVLQTLIAMEAQAVVLKEIVAFLLTGILLKEQDPAAALRTLPTCWRENSARSAIRRSVLINICCRNSTASSRRCAG